ncbi:MAG: cobalamin biosynthesis protein CbiL [Deltaproteobacteria bacterium]|nr:MAG: cobalamin biosynthesis protein CbiL [Deltaproteobacteria bacterium]
MSQFLRLAFLGCLLIGVSTPVQAHRVHLFALVEGTEIVADCRFSKSKPAQESRLQVFNAKDGSLLLEGKTDRQGGFRFPIPQQVLQNPVDLRLELDAGEGHQARWVIAASEISPQSAASVAQTPDSQHIVQPEKKNNQMLLTEQRLQEIIDRSLSARLAPIQAMLMAQQTDEPGFVEIIGGIGWIFGLFGLVAFMKSRKNKQEKR